MTAGPNQRLVERVARALCEAAGGKPDALDPIKFVPLAMRPPDAFDQDGRGCYFYWRQWTIRAQAALDACHAEEMLAALRKMRKEYGSGLTVCGQTLVEVDNLLALLDGTPSGGAV